MKKKILSLCICFTMIISLCSCSFVTVQSPYINDDGALLVHYIDVGQGDSVLLESNNDFVLIDAGEVEYGKSVCDYLKSRGVTSLDYVIATHPHSDHCGGLAEVLKTFETDNFITVETDQQTKTWLNVLYAVRDSNANYIDAKVSSTYAFGEATFEIMGPYSTNYDNYNDYSVVVKATCGATSFLFTGDAEKAAEKELLSHNAELKADVLKVGHHGSYTSTCNEFLSAIDPTYAVISCGKNNDHGHPHKETINKLDDRGILTYRTDELGTIIASSDKNSVKFHFAKETVQNKTESKDDSNTNDDSKSSYIGNSNSKKFHLSSCDGASDMKEQNKVYFNSKEEAQSNGYTPCKNCNP
ncbi:MAG: MBL fold metallo-hydrolase [Ruminococcaceae bacterium]|nr:MBL fold metallo-hydrolase [Oscillospiraceae bacterium]